MNLENFGKKIVAKTHEVLETKKAENMMTPDQRYSTGQRESYHEAKRKEGFDGEVLKSHIGSPNFESVRIGGEQLTYEAEINGHVVSGSFYFRIAFREVRLESESPATMTVDGKPLSKEAALLFARKYMKTLRSRAHNIRDEVHAVGSVQRENERAKLPQKSKEEWEEEQRQRDSKYLEKEKAREALAKQAEEELDEAFS